MPDHATAIAIAVETQPPRHGLAPAQELVGQHEELLQVRRGRIPRFGGGALGGGAGEAAPEQARAYRAAP